MTSLIIQYIDRIQSYILSIQMFHFALQSCVYTCNTPCQEALAVAVEKEIPFLGTKESFFYKLGADLKMRCDILSKSVEKAGFITIQPEAGAFLCANWKPLGIVLKILPMYIWSMYRSL
jgi:kynurenine--oxoglutarate transaminase/cysteine-S-conjugate beta-lyase/glutamine--phenylpyruvate transaminase